MRVTELADRLRHYGLTVVEVAGWQTRGNEFPERPDGSMRHWTAGPISGLTPSLGVIINGRSDLPGPLANTYQSRIVDPNGLDVVYVIASGKANHAGVGIWNGIVGNYKFLGLEIEWAGPTEMFVGVNKRQLTSELIMRAMMDCCSGTNDDDACEHREYATPKGRKIDTNLTDIRQRMAELRAGSPAPLPPAIPQPAPTPVPSPTLEYNMDTLDLRNANVSVVTGRHVDNLQALMVPILAWGQRGDLVGGLLNAYAVPDGKAGKGTQTALKVVQDILRYVGALKQDSSDMICGPATWRAVIEF